MFAALTVARLREAANEAGVHKTASWRSSDEIPATETPLAKATQKVVASMQAVLGKTYEAYKELVPAIEAQEERAGCGTGEEAVVSEKLKTHLKKTKAAEVRIVKNVRDLIDPPDGDSYSAKAVVWES